MRIAHITDCYPPRMGGIERQVHDLAAQQRRRGDDVTVFTSVAAGVEATGDREVVRPRARPGSGSTRIRYETTWLGLRAFQARGFDAVHVHASTFSPLAFAAAMDSGRTGVPTVFTLHSLLAEATGIFRAAHAVLGARRWPLRWSAVSTVAARSLRRGIGPGAPIAVVPNAVDPAEWAGPRAAPGDGSELRVITVGRLAARKRPTALIRTVVAAREIVPRSVRLQVVMVGDGPQRASLQRRLAAAGLDWITLTGPLDRADIRALHAASDVYLAPATRESFGIAALEALCAGLPVLARSGTGIGDFVEDGRNGRLLPSDRALAAALARLATDPAELSRMRQAAQAYPVEATWERVLPRWDDLYQDRAEAHPERGLLPAQA